MTASTDGTVTIFTDDPERLNIRIQKRLGGPDVRRRMAPIPLDTDVQNHSALQAEHAAATHDPLQSEVPQESDTMNEGNSGRKIDKFNVARQN
jgi:RNA recognition motif-containing protein